MRLARLKHLFSTAAVIALILALGGLAAQEIADAPAYRKFAPGVLIDIPSQLNARDSYSLPMSLPGVNAEQHTLQMDSIDKTLYGMSDRVILFRDVYQYDYATTGLRQIELDGKNYWYQIFRTRDLSETLTYEEVKEDPNSELVTRKLKKGEPVEDQFFHPRHTLEGWVFDVARKEYVLLKYRDTVNPAVVRAIRTREDPKMPLLDRVQLSKVKIPKVNQGSDVGVWGVAVWENVNPNIDFVSVYVSGLTNAYRIRKGADDSISFVRKTLQLNYWRPGDDMEEELDRVRYGIPLVDDPKEQVEVTRRYNLPGPVIRAYELDRKADRKVLVLEADAQFDLDTFTSAITPTLDKGNLPESLSKAFADAGISVNRDIGVSTLIEGKKWAFTDGELKIELVLEPQYWEPDFEGIRFIKSLDFMWIYR